MSSNNPFNNYTYSFGGWGMPGSNPWTKTARISKNELTTRAGNATPIACSDGFLRTYSGYKVNAHYLKSLHQNSNNEYDDLLLPNRLYFNEAVDFWEIPFGTKYVCLTFSKDDKTQEFTSAEIDSLYGTAFEYIPSARTYSLDGNIAVGEYSNDVFIKNLREKYPSYNDDQLLDEAIKRAKVKTNGRAAKIIWDGRDIYFAGNIQHDCYGFGGIDFNGARIYMPDYDTDFDVDYPPVIIRVLPDSYTDIIASASDFSKYATTNAALQNKVFTINDNYTGNSDMSLGDRIGFDTQIHYTPTMITMPSGEFYGSNLYLVPESGDVPCYNVHDYPAVTFEISNGIVMTRNSQKMSCLVKCSRSNVHLHNFTLYGARQNVSTYHSRYLFSFKKCTDVEVDHIEGLNPIQTSSGYVLELSSVTNAHIHDCHIGDDTKWGVMGCNHLTNGFFERCDLNRWDCHYAQYGIQTIKECNLCWIGYGVGYGSFVVDSCNFIAKAGATIPAFIQLRSDTIGVYDGNMIVKNCRFLERDAEVGDYIIWRDGVIGAKPNNSMVGGSPERNRIIENCEFPNGCNAIFKVGLSAQADKPMYQNLVYKVRDAVISCEDGIFVAITAGQAVKEVVLDGCTIGDCITVKDIANCAVKVSNCNLVAVTSNVTLPRLSITGSAFSGNQSVNNFTNYALAGNIASDMASVNKHS